MKLIFKIRTGNKQYVYREKVQMISRWGKR